MDGSGGGGGGREGKRGQGKGSGDWVPPVRPLSSGHVAFRQSE